MTKRRPIPPSDAKSTPEQLAASRARYWATDPRKRFALRANKKVELYGRPEDTLDWTTIPAGPWRCAYCGVGCESWDHVSPLRAGGANTADNLVPSCVPCNQRQNRGRIVWHANGHKTHCKRGHEFTPGNTRIGTKGERKCKACDREVYHARKVAA